MGDAERREHRRYRLWIPIRLQLKGRRSDILGVAHDVSQKGASAVVARKLEVDQPVVFVVRVPPEGEEDWYLRARVLRCDRNEADPNGLWRFKAAFEFADAVPRLEEALRNQTAMLRGKSASSEQEGL